MAEFASRFPDMRLWAITRLNPLLDPTKVSAERDEALASQVVVSVVPAQMATVVSRTFMVTVECWAADKVAAFNLCDTAAFLLASAPRKSPVVTTDLNAGPNEHRDDAGTYYYDATVMVTAQRLRNATP